jgi:CRP-like cAMP-binding protein
MPNKKLTEKCNQCLFKYIVCQYHTEEEFLELYNNTVQLKYKRGEHILKQGNNFTHIVYLSQGLVKLSYSDEFGRNLILTVVKAPSMLGGANVFNEELNMFSVIAVEETEVCLIDIKVLKSFALKNSAFALRLLDFVSAMFKDSMLNFISLAHKHVNGRVADIIIYLSKKVYKSNSFTLTLTRKEIAEFAGCSQENVIHTLSRFEKDGVIKSENKTLEILDFDKLSTISRLG